EPKATSTESWSDDWGEWPDASDEELLETLPEEAFSHEVRVPEAIRVEAPVVSMESAHVDHSTERTRIAARRSPPLEPKVVARKPHPGLYENLHGAQVLRRAFVLSEIIGPPRALKPHADPE
ncbi:MAG TPA: hypothetical protein VFI91_08980, partial [Longimicrobiaceae bacterium]|nr:hypothetical protein [Longimicrobiaceae bacterium]